MFFRYRNCQGIALCPPKFVISQPKRRLAVEGGRGHRCSSCPLESSALYGGIAEIVSPIMVSWATKLRRWFPESDPPKGAGKNWFRAKFSSGASGGSLQGGASFKAEKAHKIAKLK